MVLVSHFFLLCHLDNVAHWNIWPIENSNETAERTLFSKVIIKGSLEAGSFLIFSILSCTAEFCRRCCNAFSSWNRETLNLVKGKNICIICEMLLHIFSILLRIQNTSCSCRFSRRCFWPLRAQQAQESLHWLLCLLPKLTL